MRRALLALLLGVGCDGQPNSGPLTGGTDGGYDAEAGVGRVGASCASPSDCDVVLTCEGRLPGGYCTRPCDGPHPCPDPAAEVCVRFADDFGAFCTARCAVDAACRRGYACIRVGDSSSYICYLP